MYLVTLVARTPQQTTGPTLVEVAPILDARGLQFEDELNRPGSARLTTDPATLPAAVQARLRDLKAAPCELWVERDGTRMFAGPLLGWSLSDDGNLQLTAAGLAYYLDYMFVAADQTFTATDQWTIARTLVDQWQDLDYGNYGIDVSAVTTSGVTRDRTYLASEENWVGDRIRELGAVINGFDHHVDPASRVLVLEASRGTDLTATVVVGVGVTSPGLTASVAAGDIASEAFGRSTGDDGELLTSTAADTTVRSGFGRSAVSGTWNGISVQGTLDDHTGRLLTTRSKMLLTTEPDLIPIVGASVGDFAVGDTVVFDYDPGFGRITENRRIVRMRIQVADDGNETIALGFQ